MLDYKVSAYRLILCEVDERGASRKIIAEVSLTDIDSGLILSLAFDNLLGQLDNRNAQQS